MTKTDRTNLATKIVECQPKRRRKLVRLILRWLEDAGNDLRIVVMAGTVVETAPAAAVTAAIVYFALQALSPLTVTRTLQNVRLIATWSLEQEYNNMSSFQ
jgi:hypothetical protein